MKRSLALLLTLVLLLTSPAWSASVLAEADAKDRVMNDWLQYLYLQECLQGELEWALDYVEAFLADPTWEHLAVAQAATALLDQTSSFHALGELTGTARDYRALKQEDRDVETIRLLTDAASVELDLESFCIDTRLLKMHVHDTVFADTDLSILKDTAAAMRQEIALNRLFNAQTTNYIFTQMADEELTALFMSDVQTYCPSVAALLTELETDPDEIMAAAAVTSDAMKARKADYDRTTEEQSKLTDLVTAAYQASDLDTLMALCPPISGTPVLIRTPLWETLDGYWFYDRTVGGETVDFAVGIELPGLPTNMGNMVKDVPLEDVITYISCLEAEGFRLYSSSVMEDGSVRYYMMPPDDAYVFAITWSPEDTFLVFVDTVPLFVPEAVMRKYMN